MEWEICPKTGKKKLKASGLTVRQLRTVVFGEEHVAAFHWPGGGGRGG